MLQLLFGLHYGITAIEKDVARSNDLMPQSAPCAQRCLGEGSEGQGVTGLLSACKDPCSHPLPRTEIAQQIIQSATGTSPMNAVIHRIIYLGKDLQDH